MENLQSLLSSHRIPVRFDLATGSLDGATRTVRHLADLKGIFADETEFTRLVEVENPLVYIVDFIDSASGEGDLHYGLGTLYPGNVGGEYFMTKGHIHSWRPAAEVYICLGGTGGMLLEEELGSNSRFIEMSANSVVYVPGNTAHRTINTGSEPLIYFGIYPAAAGHDYGAIADRNFRKIIREVKGMPEVIDRSY